MSNNILINGPQHIPKGSMCSTCTKRGREFIEYCNTLPFSTYPVHSKTEFYIQVICKEYQRGNENQK